ncbi:MAG: SprT family zinc-dependent metalloprotease [Alphaproteobacteria bacterium]|nr:SprT family zinc-dependent metalloprotease [Alphaproteobacteria bacterium]
MINLSQKLIDGPLDVKISVLKSSKCQSMRLAYNSQADEFRLSVPRDAREFEIQSFLKRCEPWIEKQLSKPKPPVLCFGHGDIIPILGVGHRLSFERDPKKSIVFFEKYIRITAPTGKFASILEDGLKDLAYKILYQRSFMMAEKLGIKINSVTVKELRTRWGSCSSKKNLNFSWRLIFAPEHVVNYLCAHEVAHLVEMNHSPKFWKVVESLHPSYQFSKQWLKAHGKKIMLLSFK